LLIEKILWSARFFAGYIAEGITNGIDDVINGGTGGVHVCAGSQGKDKGEQAGQAGKFFHYLRHPGRV
jgi:hypothetical protein